MGWVKAIAELFTIINTIFTMMRERELRKQGYKKAKAEVEKRKHKNKEKADEIDNRPDVDDPWNGL